MAFVIGIDEAGYGPNLGPLAIGGTLWHVPGFDQQTDLYELLSPVVCRPADPHRQQLTRSMAVGDSKLLYSSRGRLQGLELPVLVISGFSPDRPATAPALISRLTGEPAACLLAQPGYDWSRVAVPVDASPQRIGLLRELLGHQVDASGARCLRVRARLVFPDAWNQGLQEFGNKASLLGVMSCRLVRQLLDDPAIGERPAEPVFVYCDKQGGRSRYAALIQQEITGDLVSVHHESRPSSSYGWKADGRKYRILFSSGGESQLPVALASMTAKYLRELSMRAWNEFWQLRLPGLRPTAGYPVDARRFRADISGTRQQLQIPEQTIWRNR